MEIKIYTTVQNLVNRDNKEYTPVKALGPVLERVERATDRGTYFVESGKIFGLLHRPRLDAIVIWAGNNWYASVHDTLFNSQLSPSITVRHDTQGVF